MRSDLRAQGRACRVCKLLKDHLGQQGSRGKADVEWGDGRVNRMLCSSVRDRKDVSKAVHCHAGEVKSEGMRSWPKGLVVL